MKRRTRRKAERLGDLLGTTLATYGPQAAQQLGLAEPPKKKRTAPRVALGIVIGATAVYFFEPERGAARISGTQTEASFGRGALADAGRCRDFTYMPEQGEYSRAQRAGCRSGQSDRSWI